MHERVIREATRAEDLRSYLNEQVLRQVWKQLFLPVRVHFTSTSLASHLTLQDRLASPLRAGTRFRLTASWTECPLMSTCSPRLAKFDFPAAARTVVSAYGREGLQVRRRC